MLSLILRSGDILLLVLPTAGFYFTVGLSNIETFSIIELLREIKSSFLLTSPMLPRLDPSDDLIILAVEKLD